jgi:hypothetical protein
MINPELNVGDRVILLHMEDNRPVTMGTKGTVTSKSVVFGDTQYGVDWDNGSKLSLITGVDKWDLEKNFLNRKRKKINEDEVERFKAFIKNKDIFKHFNMRFLKSYLMELRESGVVNMFGAAPYLYMGRDRIEHQFKYTPIHNEDAFENVLDMADQAQAEMINGTMNALESKGIDADLDNINRYISRYATQVVENYILLF